MKKYTEPKIIQIKLDSEQSILQVCKVGGNYFSTNSTVCAYASGSAAPLGTSCGIAIRGRQSFMANARDTSAQPS